VVAIVKRTNRGSPVVEFFVDTVTGSLLSHHAIIIQIGWSPDPGVSREISTVNTFAISSISCMIDNVSYNVMMIGIDKSLMVWKLNFSGHEITGEPLRRLKGHSHFVSDLNISLDSDFALSASWDKVRFMIIRR
jgi:WD40 repeat protein